MGHRPTGPEPVRTAPPHRGGPGTPGDRSRQAAARALASLDGEQEETARQIDTIVRMADQVVEAIACSEVKPQRISQRDSKSYFAVLLDDSNRKPIARLHFNARSKKYLGTFDAAKNETRHRLGSVDGIYLHAERIRESVRNYLG